MFNPPVFRSIYGSIIPWSRYVEQVQREGSEELKALIGGPERWGFETLTEEEIQRTTAAEPLWPEGRPEAELEPRGPKL